jgi:hypothetical protein
MDYIPKSDIPLNDLYDNLKKVHDDVNAGLDVLSKAARDGVPVSVQVIDEVAEKVKQIDLITKEIIAWMLAH